MLPLDVKDLILIHLQGFEEFRDDEEVPYGLTPKGITDAVGISEKKPYTNINELEEEGLIEEFNKIVTGKDRKRNVYFLTDKGKESEEGLWDKIKKETVILKEDGEEKKIKLKKAGNFIEGRNPALKLLKNIDEDKIVKMEDIGKTDIFVGRQDVLQELQKILKQTKRSGTNSVFIKGEAGIGKTTLVSHLKPYADELGYDFIKGTCQSEISDPYLPFKEAFSSYIENGKRSNKSSSIAFLGTTQGPKAEDKKMFDAQRKATFYETTKCLKEMTEDNPLLVFLDDLQWVDRATLEILSYMNEKMEDSPVLFIGAYRPEDINDDHPLHETIHRLNRIKKLDKIQLEPLDIKNTKDIIEGLVGTSDIPEYFIKNLHRKTEGNPLFVKESLQQMLEDDIIDPKEDRYPEQSDEIAISDLIHTVIERRINRLDDQTIKIIEIGSVIGEKIDFDLLTRTSDMDEIDLLDHIDMLTGNQLWLEDTEEEAFYFSHELIEDTVYNRIKGLKKRLLHKRVAKNISDIFKDELEERYPRLAFHYENAEEYDKALDYYLKAGERAEKFYAHEDAIEMYKKAFELSEHVSDGEIADIEILQKIAKAYSISGDYEEARKYLNKGLKRTEDEKEKQSLLRKISDSYYEQSLYKESLEHIEKGLSIYDKPCPERCRILSTQGWIHIQKGEYDKASEIFEEERKVAEKIDSKKDMGQVFHDLGTVALQISDLDEAVEKLKTAIDIRERICETRDLSKSLNNIGITYFHKGDLENAKENYQRSLDILEEIGDKKSYSTTLNNLAGIYSKEGDLEKSLKAYEESLEISQMIGDKHGEAISLGNLAGRYMDKGDLEKALEYFDRSIKIKKEVDDRHGLSIDMVNMGMINQKKGNLGEAEKYQRKSLEISEEIGDRRGMSISYTNLGDVYIHKGDYDKAEKFYNKAYEIDDEIGSKNTLCFSLKGLGKIYRLKGDIKKAIQSHKKGIEIGQEIKDEEVILINKTGLAEDYFFKKDFENAHKISEEVVNRLENIKDPSIIIDAKLVLGKCLREQNILNESSKYLDEALEDCRRYKDKILEAKTLFERGKLRIRGDDKEKGLKDLEKALNLFEKIEMSHWIEKVEKEIREAR